MVHLFTELRKYPPLIPTGPDKQLLVASDMENYSHQPYPELKTAFAIEQQANTTVSQQKLDVSPT